MKAMLFAAGLGTRLKPLTNNKPKAMVEVNGVPLLELVIKNLISQGVTGIIVNVHHFAQTIIDFLDKKSFGVDIQISDETDCLLDTGGGLLKAAPYFDNGKAFLVHNVDILSNIDLARMYKHHCESGSIATLAVRNRKTSRYFLFDARNQLCGWKNMATSEIKIARKPDSKLRSLAFSGIHIIDPKIFRLIDEQKSFSITDVYIRLAMENIIGCYLHDRSSWMDLGRIECIREAEKMITEGKLINRSL